MNIVTSCHQVESCVLGSPIGVIWDAIKSLDFAKFLPSSVSSVKFVTGDCNDRGSVFSIEYLDCSEWTYRIVEISESRRTISYELIDAKPDITFSSLQVTIKLYQVTENNSTFLMWETDYSNDVNASIVQDGKFKKLDAFQDLRKIFP